ncbi:MAG: GntR family transcriptional regulator [Actinomycetes bacterium]
MFAIDSSLPIPPYKQICDQVARGRASGDLPAQHRLPTVRKLAAELGVAANTVARAYRELEESGLIETRGRHGSFVTGTEQSATALPRADVDPGGLLEYSVVYADRALNHMSSRFVAVMQDIIGVLTDAYRADRVAVVPGGGTYAMEAVARQLAQDKRCLVVRNGFFSYRWSQILQQCRISDDVTVVQARPVGPQHQAAWTPAPIADVVAALRESRAEVVFAPHVETASGMMLPDAYLTELGAAVREAGAIFVLDCIASGAMWVDMEASGVDVLLSAPQKGWSGSPGAGFVMLSRRAAEAVQDSESSSFSADLRRWLAITDGYAEGRHAYHATMPTDALARSARAMLETRERGFEALRAAQLELGARVRALLAARGYPSLAADGFHAPGVAVVYTDDPERKSGAAFAAVGVQAAAGVPLQCGEPEDFSTVRFGLFGLEKLTDVQGTVARLERALDRMAEVGAPGAP